MKAEKIPPVTPRGPARAPQHSSAETERSAFSWEALVPLVLHPVKVAVIEAILWIDRPLSPTQLTESFDAEEYYLGIVSHHLNELARLGAVKLVKTRQVPGKGAKEKFFFFA